MDSKEDTIDALKYIYKHLLGDVDITEEEAIIKTCDTLCNLMGDQEFQKFFEEEVK